MSVKTSLTGAEERAAWLVADDKQTDLQIAQSLGKSDRWLYRLKNRPEFSKRVDEIRVTIGARIVNKGIADKQRRVDILNEVSEKIERVFAARAQALSDVPGGDTGIIVEQIKLASNGDQVTEYVVDNATLKERRATLQQAAQELGQWTEKKELSGELLVRQYVGVSIEDV